MYDVRPTGLQWFNDQEADRLAEEEEQRRKEEEEERKRIQGIRDEAERRRLERELQERLKREAGERARQARERARQAEEREAAIQLLIQSLGVCSAGFPWCRVPGGYRCSAWGPGQGSHFLSNNQLGL